MLRMKHGVLSAAAVWLTVAPAAFATEDVVVEMLNQTPQGQRFAYDPAIVQIGVAARFAQNCTLTPISARLGVHAAVAVRW